MRRQVFEAVLLFAIFGSLSCLEQAKEYGTAKIGEKCERDRNCIEHAYCRVQMTCLCDQYYSPTFDKSMCVASDGLGCTDDSACRTMANAACRQGKCTCKDSYLLDTKNSSNCISKPSREGDRCQRDDDCQDALGHAMCIDERCLCISNYHFANETRKCVQSKFLYNSCKMDYECIAFDDETVLECRNGECVCKAGEVACSKGSTYAFVGIPVILLTLFHRFV